MLFEQLSKKYDFVEFCGQKDSGVTYIFVYNRPISRLNGDSDILYIGETKQPISKRYRQETSTDPKNSQFTNIRTTHIYQKLGLSNIRCYYFKGMEISLSQDEFYNFIENLRFFDMNYRDELLSARVIKPVNFEKYLLVSYSAEHFELPPLNNRT